MYKILKKPAKIVLVAINYVEHDIGQAENQARIYSTITSVFQFSRRNRKS